MSKGLRRVLCWVSVLSLTLSLFSLPEGSVQARSHHRELPESVVMFQIGSPVYTVDGQPYEMDVSPRIDPRSERTLLPVRYAAEAMNAQVYWNPEGRRITIVHNETGRVLELAIGEDAMYYADAGADAEVQKLDQAPVVDDPGRTMLPIRAVAEALYGRIAYDPATRTISITRPATSPPTLEPAPDQISFGQLLPMDHNNMDSHGENVRQVPITNRGRGPLMVDGVSLESGKHFELCGQRFEPFVLQPGESRSILLCARAMEQGQFEDTLLIRSRVQVPTDLIIKPIRIWVFILGCRVSITGGGLRPNILTSGQAPLGPAGIDDPVVNVGQQMSLQAVATGHGPFSYHWSVAGNHIKDYSEVTSAPWSTTSMVPADYTQSTIGYYWKQTGLHKVSVTVTNRFGFSCSASKTFNVERNNTDINRQAEDFYTWNHNSAVLVEHRQWHQANPSGTCALGAGLPFKTYHETYIARFNSWRAEFGYPQIVAWNPGTNLPGGIANAHAARAGVYNPAPNKVPTYLTLNGGAAVSACWGATKRTDFTTDNYWRAVELLWHNPVHGAIGGATGDMSSVARAPKDPIFWRFHKFVDSVHTLVTVP